MGPAVCSLLYGAHPFVAGMYQALSGPMNSPTGFREPCRLGSGFGNWTECFKAPTSQHLLKTQTLLFFLTEVSYSGFRILPCVSPQSCLSFPISVPTTQVPGTVLSLLGGGGGFPACPPLVLSFFSVASSMRASRQPWGMAGLERSFPRHAEHNPASLAWPRASDVGPLPPSPAPLSFLHSSLPHQHLQPLASGTQELPQFRAWICSSPSLPPPSPRPHLLSWLFLVQFKCCLL